jgi:hypothetical protein
LKRLDDYKYKGKVDSEVILSYIEKYGLKEGLSKIGGSSASLAILPFNERNTLYLFRHYQSLVMGYDDSTKTLIFGSTEFIVKSATPKVAEYFQKFSIVDVPSDHLLKITINPFHIEDQGELKQSYSNYETKSYSYTGYTSNAGHWDHTKKRWVYDDEVGEKNGNIKLLKGGKEENKDPFALSRLEWDSGSLVYSLESKKHGGKKEIPKERRLYLHSVDWANWSKITGVPASVSNDLRFVKIWDRVEGKHFISTVVDAFIYGIIPIEDA